MLQGTPSPLLRRERPAIRLSGRLESLVGSAALTPSVPGLDSIQFLTLIQVFT